MRGAKRDDCCCCKYWRQSDRPMVPCRSSRTTLYASPSPASLPPCFPLAVLAPPLHIQCGRSISLPRLNRRLTLGNMKEPVFDFQGNIQRAGHAWHSRKGGPHFFPLPRFPLPLPSRHLLGSLAKGNLRFPFISRASLYLRIHPLVSIILVSIFL